MDLPHHLPALQVIVPMLAAPLILLLQPRGLAWAGATLVAILSFIIALSMAVTVSQGTNFSYDMGGWPAPYGIELFIGPFGALVLVIVTGGSCAVPARRASQRGSPD